MQKGISGREMRDKVGAISGPAKRLMLTALWG